MSLAHRGELQVIREVLLDAGGTLAVLRLRTLLAVLGVTVGTAAVITMLHIGYTAKSIASRQLEDLGINLVRIGARDRTGEQTDIPESFAATLVDSGIGIDAAVPILQGSGTLRYGHASLPVSVLATTDEFFSIVDTDVRDGRRTSKLDGAALFALLGHDLAETIATATGERTTIGVPILVNDKIVTVVGVLRPTPPRSVLSVTLDRSVVVPLSAAPRLLEGMPAMQVAARLTKGVDERAAVPAIARSLETALPESSAEVQTARQLVESFNAQMMIYTQLLAAIGGVSFLVSGAGIMNVMLMTVTERRQEIGLKLALGAKRRHIMVGFLAEATAISVVGSVLGVLCGMVSAVMFSRYAGWPLELAPAALPLAVTMAVAVGVFFGAYPAHRAARLDPIAALKSD